jgi:hypothetical protein
VLLMMTAGRPSLKKFSSFFAPSSVAVARSWRAAKARLVFAGADLRGRRG